MWVLSIDNEPLAKHSTKHACVTDAIERGLVVMFKGKMSFVNKMVTVSEINEQ